jgi:hypothetical protein
MISMIAVWENEGNFGVGQIFPLPIPEARKLSTSCVDKSVDDSYQEMASD